MDIWESDLNIFKLNTEFKVMIREKGNGSCDNTATALGY